MYFVYIFSDLVLGENSKQAHFEFDQLDEVEEMDEPNYLGSKNSVKRICIKTRMENTSTFTNTPSTGII